MTNQSDRYDIVRAVTDICFDNGGVTRPMAEKLADYIQANYTPNNEVHRLEREARIDELEETVFTQGNYPPDLRYVSSGDSFFVVPTIELESRIAELSKEQS